jgi:hypothetical protein
MIRRRVRNRPVLLGRSFDREHAAELWAKA